MVKRKAGFFQKPEFRFYLALAFLLWSLVPHYELVVHSHEGNDAGHQHTTLSKTQIQLADQAAMALAADGKPVEGDLFAGEETYDTDFCSGLPSLASGGKTSTHAHFQEDLNVAGLTYLPLQAPDRIHPALNLPDLYREPHLTARVSTPVRGPPPFLPA